MHLRQQALPDRFPRRVTRASTKNCKSPKTSILTAMPKHCLLIEDRTEDALQVKNHLSKAGDFGLHWVTGSDEAMRYLKQEGGFHDVPWPDLLLLDLHLPGMHGFTFLEWFRKETKLPQTPVMVLTISGAPEDMRHAEKLGVRSFLTKPLNWTRFSEELSLITGPAQRMKPLSVPTRSTCVLTFADGKKVAVSAEAQFEGQTVPFKYGGDTSLFRPFASEGTLGFFKWYMEGIAANLDAHIKFFEERL